MERKWIDFNVLLRVANFLVGVALIVTFSHTHGNEYVDRTTVGLAILLCIQTDLALLVERRRRDPFVILLALDMIFFFALRIVTLTLYPFSIVFDRYGFTAGDSNYALVFILAANVILYAGLYAAGSCKSWRIDSVGWRAKTPGRVVFLMIAALMFAYFSSGYWNQDSIPRALGFLVIFFTPTIVILMSLAYYLLFRKSLSRKVAVAIVALMITDAVIHTLSGSRGAIIVIGRDIVIVALAMAGCIRLPRKYVLVGIALLPAVAALLVATFVISTYNRSSKEAGQPLEIGRAFELAATASDAIPVGTDLDLLLPPIADRAGYFDFSAEIIANRDKYASVLTVSSYSKSIIDNVLTPGFDLFDQPKISNALKFFYDGLGTPSKVLVVADSYQSDQLGIYGEFYGLFGYGCLPLLLLMAFAFKRVYLGLSSQDPFVLAMKRAVVLVVFVWTIDSYGVDWTILESLPLVGALFIYTPFFSSQRVLALKGPRGAPLATGTGHLTGD